MTLASLAEEALSRMEAKPAGSMTQAEQRDYLAAHFIRCLPYLQKAIDRADGAFDTAHVWNEIETGNAQLWWAPNSAIVTRIETPPSGRKTILFWLAGGTMDECKVMHAQIVEWARRQGCVRSQIIGRDWSRALNDGYRKVAVVLTKDID